MEECSAGKGKASTKRARIGSPFRCPCQLRHGAVSQHGRVEVIYQACDKTYYVLWLCLGSNQAFSLIIIFFQRVSSPTPFQTSNPPNVEKLKQPLHESYLYSLKSWNVFQSVWNSCVFELEKVAIKRWRNLQRRNFFFGAGRQWLLYRFILGNFGLTNWGSFQPLR